ncbi:MAG: alpha/beta hydrolase domain-containing protein [Candidatus Acidiferrum sp.]
MKISLGRVVFHTILTSLILLAAIPSLSARVTRVEIVSRADVLGGQSFGDAGLYERITGKIFFSVAVANIHNKAIVDLENAVNLQNGEVEFSADFVAVRPKDASKGNGTVFLENPNRGLAGILSLVDGGDRDLSKSAGDAWFLRNGYTLVSLGWQWDAVGLGTLALRAPIAKDHGKAITGLLRGDFMPSEKMDEIPLGHLMQGRIGGAEYPVSEPDDPRNSLSVRDSREAKRTIIPRSEWQFASTIDGKLTPSDRSIHLNGGFQPGRIYEYIYAVKDPVIVGLGFAAFRDFASYAKHDATAITPAARVIAEGISQNGRFLRHFLYQGFNADEDGRIAIDGILSHVAGAGRGSFNHRFAQPSRDAQPTSSIFFPTDIFPFTDQPEVDPLTGEKGGLLDRAVAEKVVPKIFFSHTSYEYWGRAASLIHTTADAKKDVELNPNVRIYFFTGLQHYSVQFPPARGEGPILSQNLQTPLPIRFFWRSMIANMNAWLRNSTAPPPSAYPTLASHSYRWPQPDRMFHSVQYGNELSGIHLPEITVPLATYTGWNLRDPSIGAPTQRLPFEGSFFPFPKDAAEREKSGDPRKSIAERYPSREMYLEKFTNATDSLIQQRWILPEDRAALLQRAADEWNFLTR